MKKMLSSIHLQDSVIAPAPDKFNPWSRAAKGLVSKTAIVESALTYLRPHGYRLDLDPWQVEPETHENLYTNILIIDWSMVFKLMEQRAPNLSKCENHATNLVYCAAVRSFSVIGNLIPYRRQVTSTARLGLVQYYLGLDQEWGLAQ